MEIGPKDDVHDKQIIDQNSAQHRPEDFLKVVAKIYSLILGNSVRGMRNFTIPDIFMAICTSRDTQLFLLGT